MCILFINIVFSINYRFFICFAAAANEVTCWLISKPASYNQIHIENLPGMFYPLDSAL